MGKQTNNNLTNEAEVALYLENNPLFFSNHSGLLATMHLPNPHGSGTVSLAERQQVAQRDKIRQIERKYNELLQFGIENDDISKKVHSLTLALLNASNLAEILNAANSSLKNDFDIAGIKVILWAEPKNNDDASHVAFEEIDNISKAWAEGLIDPYCGALPNVNLSSIKINDEVKSYAITPLEVGIPVGLLAIASNDEKRFYPEMGTVFVKRIGELLSAALSRHLL
jgi:uncharacterized protein YigA (DUF484 family)